MGSDVERQIKHRMNQTAFLNEVGKICLREIPISLPEDDEVLIEIHRAGICGSDISYFTKGRTGVGAVTFPHILGHECAGIVVDCGKNVTAIQKGDRVAIEPGLPCGSCNRCLSGHYNLCPKLSFMSTAKKMKYSEGAFRKYVIRSATLVHKLPDAVSMEQGAMLEPLSVAIHAVRRSGIIAGQAAAILGSGPIALAILMVLHANGIRHVSMTDIQPDRLEKARLLGAENQFCTAQTEESEQRTLINRQSVHAVFDTTCNAQAINASLEWIDAGGCLVQVGVPSGRMELDLQTLFSKEVDIRPSFRYANTYAAAIDLVACGIAPVEQLITHRFPLGQVQQAMNLAAGRKEGVMKIMLCIS